ncbi:MAG: carbamate kinase [Clostridiales bacterium]|nr:carbamate kinase [Clostridiales bacterium]
MSKRIVIALGGNALGATLSEQAAAVRTTAKAIVDLIEAGNEVIVAHGNGPQVGIINNAMTALTHEDKTQGNTPLSVCGAMSQAYIGYDLQNGLREELLSRGINKPVCTIVTQTVVDANDPAFKSPSKPIGKFLSKEEADEVAAKTGYLMKEDAGRGYRRYVASPKPVSIVEAPCIKSLSEAGCVVVACGGGGIPVIAEGNHLRGAAAVIDKDFGSEMMAELLDADMLIILTAVEKVAINFRKENEEWLSDLTPAMAAQYEAEGQFAAGSMLPKVQAAVKFAQSKPGRTALITLLEKAKDGIAGKTGTSVHL